MTDREIMQQALDYIKETYDFCVVMQQPKEREEQLMKSLEVALAQPEPVQVRPHEFIAMASKQANMIGKPVVWAEYPTPHKIILDEGWEWGHEARAKESLAQPEQESISTNDHLCAMLRQVHDVLACTALPMKRPWVGLTGLELNHIFAANVEYPERMCRAIEAALRSKNEY